MGYLLNKEYRLSTREKGSIHSGSLKGTYVLASTLNYIWYWKREISLVIQNNTKSKYSNMLIVWETVPVTYLKIHSSILWIYEWNSIWDLLNGYLKGANPDKKDPVSSSIFPLLLTSNWTLWHEVQQPAGPLDNSNRVLWRRASRKKTSSGLLISRILTYKHEINF